MKAGPLLEACTLDVAVIGKDAAAKVFVDETPPAAVGTLAGGGILQHLEHWWMLLPFAVILIAAWFLMRRSF